jgi:predicted metal-dependent hydrolase
MQEILQFGNKRIEFSIVIKKRKTIGLSVSREDGLRVSAPKWVSKKQIMNIVEQKAEWIFKKLSEYEQMPNVKEIENGTELFFLGFSYNLEIKENLKLKKIKINKIDDKIELSLPSGLNITKDLTEIKNALILWYKEQAKTIITQRIKKLADEMQLNPVKITIRQQKTRWGSCSSKGNININWKLVMMPVSVLDYVLVHELAHLKVLNHSKSFWKLVETYLPDFKVRRQSLKEFGKKLNLL